MRRKNAINLILGCVITAFVSIGASFFTFAWFLAPGGRAENRAIDGEIGLRDYFYDGDGTVNTPFEIVYPNQFYNLARLQNLGVFGDPEHRTYFQIGHVFDAAQGPVCLDSSSNRVKYLDMSSFCETKSILPIGGEGTPFYGYFDGSFIPVYGLRVAGNPEDIGVFGYIPYEGQVENLILQNLEVTSLGYTNNPSDEENFLFGQTIRNIFAAEATNFETASLSFTPEAGGNPVKLKTLTPYSLSNIYDSSKRRESPDSDILKGFFTPTFPSIEGHSFNYSISSSTPIIEIDANNVATVNLRRMPSEFAAGDEVQTYSRISIIASITVAGYTYSRVIQSYTVHFVCDGLDDNDVPIVNMEVTCDYVDSDGDGAINYHHGNNIGLLAGHVEGNMSYCYVYDGAINLNQDDDGLVKIASETQTGLIGEIGSNVSSEMDPDYGATEDGDTGVLNFSHIYSLIREDFREGDEVTAGYYHPSNSTALNSYKGFVSYAVNDGSTYGPRGVADSFNTFKEYLRTDNANPKNYITYAGNQGDINNHHELSTGTDYTIPAEIVSQMNSVDFGFNKVIYDKDEENPILGVFQIATCYNDGLASDESLRDSLWLDNIGESNIVNGTPKTKIYFSTAEARWQDPLGGWSNGISPTRMNTIPDYSDTGTFAYPFSRDFNYVFELDLSQAGLKAGKNYMYNTDSDFLTNYLRSILIDKNGGFLAHGTRGFGFMFRFAEVGEQAVTSLSSYMNVRQPGNKKAFTINGETRYIPPRSIVFKIDNPNGANVSVAGNGGDISIYSYDPTTPDNDLTQLYTMSSSNNRNNNEGRFFTYDYLTGETSTVVKPQGNGMRDSDFVWGHIFTLPQGNYVIGARSGSANIYYLAVQGQTNAQIGEKETVTIGNEIINVDLLLESPLTISGGSISRSAWLEGLTQDQTKVELEAGAAKVYFQGNFSDQGITSAGFRIKTVDGVPYINLTYDEELTLYLRSYCLADDPVYYVNNEKVTEGETIYRKAS